MSKRSEPCKVTAGESSWAAGAALRCAAFPVASLSASWLPVLAWAAVLCVGAAETAGWTGAAHGDTISSSSSSSSGADGPGWSGSSSAGDGLGQDSSSGASAAQGNGSASTGSGGESDPVVPDPAPVAPSAPTARWFVSRRDGADTADCGLSAAAPCATPRFAYYHRITEYSYPAVADAPDASTRLVDPVLFVHALGGAGAYECDEDAEGGVMWIYSNLVLAAYTVDEDGPEAGAVRTALDADAPSIDSVAAAMAHQLRRFQTEIAPLQRDEQEPANDAPLRRLALPGEHGPGDAYPNGTSSLPLASFDCGRRGRAFFIYNGALVRLVGIQVTRGLASKSTGVETTMGGAVLVHGPAALVIERSSFSDNSARDGGEPLSADAVDGDERGGAIALLNTPFFVAIESVFRDNAATLGGALHAWQYSPDVDASQLGLAPLMAPLSSFAWLDRCTLEDNEATVDGGAISHSFVLAVPDPPPASPAGMVLRGVAFALSRSLVRRNRVAGPLVERKGGALSFTGIFFAHSWLVLASNLFADNVVGELRGASLAVLDTLDHGSGGAVSIWLRGSFVSSSLLLSANRFVGNRAPLKGGAVLIECRAQQGMLLWAANNMFERNAVRNQAHTSSGGALLLHYGPRLDAATCATAPSTVPLGPNGALLAVCDPAAPPSALASRFLLHSNVFVRNRAQGFGGALNVFYQTGYNYMDLTLAAQQVGALLENVPYAPARNASALVFDPSSFAGAPGGPDQGEGLSPSYPPDELRITGATLFHSNAVFVNASLGPVLGLGGAALLKLDADPVMPLTYDFVAERLHFLSYAFRTRVTINNASFVNNSASTPVPEEAGARAAHAAEPLGDDDDSAQSAAAATEGCGNCFGGGLFMQHGVLELNGCEFVGNRASGFGGALYLDRDSTRLRARSTLFQANRAAVGGQAIYSLSAASHVLQQCVIDMRAGAEPTGEQQGGHSNGAAAAGGNLVPHLLSPTGGQIDFFNSTLLVCPPGFSLRNDSIHSYRGSDTGGDGGGGGGGVFVGMLLSSRSYSCEPCPPNTWALARGLAVDDAWEPQRARLACAPCPFGADCANGIDDIKAREGVWGAPRLGSRTANAAADEASAPAASVSTRIAAYARLHLAVPSDSTAPPALSFHVCPEGYCCEAGRVCPLSYCTNHRTGVLCSQCATGFTFVLGSSSCRAQSSCGADAAIFWPLTIIGTGLVSLALLALRLYGLVQERSANARPQAAAVTPATKSKGAAAAEDQYGCMHSGAESESALSPLLLLRVLLFYYQLFGMVIPSASRTATHAFAVWVSAIATFQFSNQLASEGHNDDHADADAAPADSGSGASLAAGGGICVQSHLSGWQKISYGYLFPSLVVLWLLVWMGAHALLRRYSNPWLQRAAQRAEARLQAKTKGTVDAKAGGAAPAPAPAPGLCAPASLSSPPAPVQSDDVELREVHSDGLDSDPTSVCAPGRAAARRRLASQDAHAHAHAHLQLSSSSAPPPPPPPPSPLSCPCHPSVSSWSPQCVLGGVALDLLLTCYTAFLKTTAALVTCVRMDGQTRLFQAADVTCYTPAQAFALFVLVLVSALPVLLAALPRLYPCVGVVGPGLQRYRRSCAAWYESVLMLRRLVFVLLSTFIVADAFLRALLLLFLCVGAAFLHQALHPFRHRGANALESACLAALTCACAISMRAATLQDAQASDAQADGGGMADAMERLQLVLLVAPPALAALLLGRSVRRARANRLAAKASAAQAQAQARPLKEEPEEELAVAAPTPLALVPAVSAVGSSRGGADGAGAHDRAPDADPSGDGPFSPSDLHVRRSLARLADPEAELAHGPHADGDNDSAALQL